MDHIAVQARLQPQRPALDDLGAARKWTYLALDQAIDRCAFVLQQDHGLLRGQRIATVARNCAELLLLHWACARTGLIYVPLNWRLSAAELTALVADCAPSLLVLDDVALSLASAAPRLGVADLARAVDKAQALPRQKTDPQDISLILYTSGTSGKPKGVMLSEENLAQTALNFSLLGRVSHDSVFLCDSPMFHIIGLVTSMRPAFLQGSHVIISDGFNPERTLARMADPALQVTHYFCVPQMAAMLRQQPGFNPDHLRHMTGIFTGGAPQPKSDIMAWVEDGLSIIDGYGLSEAGTIFGMSVERSVIREKAGSAGIPTSTIKLRIIDNNGAECGAGQAGELLLKGANVTSGYWGQPEATKDAFTADGWFRTGDIVQRDEEGFYYIVDRKKDMYISGGENVYPAEIEAALADLPHVRELAVIGVPDARWGEVGHLVLVCEKGHAVTMAQVLDHLEPRLARYKLPRHLTLYPALPRTGSGKIRKTDLLKQLTHGVENPLTS